MRIALMIEGQEDVTWEDWVALADTCERSGIETLFRSDHYLSVLDPPAQGERGALDAWAIINALAARTTKLRLGTMVSPTSFRHPSVLARLVIAADHVSGGRIDLGMGTGWSEIEHSASGFPFLSMKERMDVLEEQLEIVHDGYFGDGSSFSFKGEHYELEGLTARPLPVQKPHPPLIMGGAAGPRAARLAARYADEYNTVAPTLDEIRERKAKIDAACAKAGRDPIPFTVMTPSSVGKDHPDATDTWINGSVEQVKARLAELEAAGVSGAYLQMQDHRDLEMVELIGNELT